MGKIVPNITGPLMLLARALILNATTNPKHTTTGVTEKQKVKVNNKLL
jgi:hypothetical protein